MPLFLSNSILPVTQAHAAGPTVNGQWSNNCTVFTVTSTYLVDTQSILDVYQSGATPGMNVKDVSYSGTAYLAQPLVFNTANGTNGFTIQVDNTTILTTQTCATISTPTVTMTPLTCNTVSFSGMSGNMDYETFYPRSVRIKNTAGTYVYQKDAALGGIIKGDRTYILPITGEAKLATGTSYTAEYGLWYNGAWYAYANSAAVTIPADCRTVIPLPTYVATDVCGKTPMQRQRLYFNKWLLRIVSPLTSRAKNLERKD